MQRVLIQCTAAAVLSLALAGAAQAVPMVYTYEVNASGQLNGQAFTDADVTITLAVDTTTYAWPVEGNIALGVHATSSLIEVEGVGSDRFAQPIAAVSNFVGGYLGFGEPQSDYGIFFVEHPSALTWTMRTPLGPLSGEASGNPGIAFDTLGGSFTFDSFAPDGTFVAVNAPVPEPGSWVLMLGGLVAVARLVRRAQRLCNAGRPHCRDTLPTG